LGEGKEGENATSGKKGGGGGAFGREIWGRKRLPALKEEKKVLPRQETPPKNTRVTPKKKGMIFTFREEKRGH